MPPATTPSNIRAYVQWREASVYAGEEIECIITFKNIATASADDDEDHVQTPLANGHGHSRAPSYAASTAPSRRTSIAQSRPLPSRALSGAAVIRGPPSRGHKPALSLNVVSAPSGPALRSAPLPTRTSHNAVQSAKGHGRSLSIMSLGSDLPSEAKGPKSPIPGRPGLKSSKGHGRSASLQFTPRPAPLRRNTGFGAGSARQPSPLYESSTPPALAEADPAPIQPGRRRPAIASANSTPSLGRQARARRGPKANGFDNEFKFPAHPAARRSPSPPKSNGSPLPPSVYSGPQRSTSPRPPEGWSGALSNLKPISRVLSDSSTVGGTPRSSSDFYTMSNHSDETITSEVPLQLRQSRRLLPKQAHSRQPSQSRQNTYPRPAGPEMLMMGYVQTMGSFTLDGSLVNAAPFEEVKRKGAQTGGGVVGVERSKRASGMFGAFSWGNIGESLGGLLGGDEMSSMAQMKATAGSRSIPLLSTPQSLLFVDLRLAPGESRSYNYRFALPRGLPPSHRGRALKVEYHLSIGVQRPGGQAAKQVEVPLRVLGSYTARGETLGHDLMSPYILLQDTARTTSVTPAPSSLNPAARFSAKEAQKTVKAPKQALEDFLRYAERLLEPSDDVHGALLSPTSPGPSPSISRKQSMVEQLPTSMKGAIDLAVLRSNFATSSGKQKSAEAQSLNRFNIARSGQLVGILTLLRPAYRLGEAVMGIIDFTAPTQIAEMPAQAPTYAVLLELESAERVDPSLALRSSTSITRVTRKVHASVRENTIFARQVSFTLTIPHTATPTFETTGVSLHWRLRVDFTTQRQQSVATESEDQSAGDDAELLEELGTDERGTALIAKEKLLADTFEIAVPLKVYGVAGLESGGGGEGDALEPIIQSHGSCSARVGAVNVRLNLGLGDAGRAVPLSDHRSTFFFDRLDIISAIYTLLSAIMSTAEVATPRAVHAAPYSPTETTTAAAKQPATVNILLTSFAGLGLPRTLSVPVSASTPIRDVVATIYSRLPRIDHALLITTTNNKQLLASDTTPLSTLLSTPTDTFLPLRLSVRLCGGKGGFGSQLRAAGGRMSSRKKRGAQQDPNGSNRNLDGRRLRTIDEAKKLAEYLAVKPDMEKKEREERRKRWEGVVVAAERREEEVRSGKTGAGHGRLDAGYVESKEAAEEKTREAVIRAMREEMRGEGRTGSESSVEGREGESDEEGSSGSSEEEKIIAQTAAGQSFFGWEDEDEDEESEADGHEEAESGLPSAQYAGKGKGKAV
ncbi:Golgi membrane exchange factor (Ric1p-Rgp1p) subunit [Teratosphaeriaceae sp. CCFEE 6253]|nr:Golgi membrane exchange factor (Ric1p-Rgp1p) subunit [Teratosphaeriaceae sp. CCFEE 6253]